MLQNLSEKVRLCMQKAEECSRRARIERDPNLVRDYRDMERRWLKLARSYQFSEQLETFHKYNKRRQEDALNHQQNCAEDHEHNLRQGTAPQRREDLWSDFPAFAPRVVPQLRELIVKRLA